MFALVRNWFGTLVGHLCVVGREGSDFEKGGVWRPDEGWRTSGGSGDVFPLFPGGGVCLGTLWGGIEGFYFGLVGFNFGRSGAGFF